MVQLVAKKACKTRRETEQPANRIFSDPIFILRWVFLSFAEPNLWFSREKKITV